MFHLRSLLQLHLTTLVIWGGLVGPTHAIPLVQEEEISEFFSDIATDEINERPIIGILSQELSKGMQEAYGHLNYSSYIAASYVKFVEAAGARVVPIRINQDDEYYEILGNSLNGFLIPGGAASLEDSGYSRAAQKIYDIVKRNHSKEETLPLWATCLGFEIVMSFEAEADPLTRCNASNVADPLFFKPGFKASRLFGNMSEELLKDLATQNITANFHKWCVLPKTFYNMGLNKSFNLLSTSEDRSGVEYVSTIEHKHLPIFATQWHPEKAAFEWANDAKHDSIPHSIEAIRVSQAMAEKFIEEARHNLNHFLSEEEEMNYLIYNYSPFYVALGYPSSFQQCYFFK